MESPAEPAGATVPPKLPRPRTTRARTSGEYLADVFFVIAPSSQELEPPAIPGRFSFIEGRHRELDTSRRRNRGHHRGGS